LIVTSLFSVGSFFLEISYFSLFIINIQKITMNLGDLEVSGTFNPISLELHPDDLTIRVKNPAKCCVVLCMF